MGLSFGDGTAVSSPTMTASYLASIPVELGEPARLAFDKNGFLYTSIPTAGSVLRLSPDGSHAGVIRGFREPLSLAVNSGLNRLYVGDVGDGSVMAVDPGGAVLFSLGIGRGEFGMPGDIAIASDGTVYVTDSSSDSVRAYAPDGTYRFSFGGSGTLAGQMIFPTGITIDDSKQEVYIVDHTNGRVEVFDLAGSILRSFSGFGGGAGRLTRPQGIWVARGQVFVADAFQSSVAVFDQNGAALGRIGQLGSGAGGLQIPKDVAVSGGKLFVTNTGNRRVEVFSLFDPLGLRMEPSSLAFTKEITVTPASQAISVTPQVPGASVPWTASVSAPFPVLLSQTAGTAPSTVIVAPDAGNLAPGTYFGGVIFHANETDYPVSLSMTVDPYVSVSPARLSMLHQIGGELSAKSLGITGPGTFSWTASVNVPWLTLSPLSGPTPGSITVAMNRKIRSLAEGTYAASVSVSAAGGTGSATVVPVTVQVMKAGTIIVSMNIGQGSAVITGPGTYAVSGSTRWQTDEAKPGTYSIRYGRVKGYRTPLSRTFELRTGETVVLDGSYRSIATANVIAATNGPGPGNDALVQLLDLSGDSLVSFKAFGTFYGAQVAMGDLDGDGSDEIVVAPGPGPDNAARIAVFHPDGTPLASTPPLTGTKYGAQAAVGDIDGRGRTVIAMSAVDGSRDGSMIVLYGLKDGRVLVEKSRIEDHDGKDHYPASLAFGDIDHDGRFELIAVRSERIEIYGFDDAFVPSLRSAVPIPFEAERSEDYKTQPTVTTGDVDGDDVDEIIVGYEQNQDSFIRMLKGDLSALGAAVKVFEKRKSAPTLSARDWNGDGSAEILAGQGAIPANEAIVRIFGPGGDLLREISIPAASRYGIIPSFGTVKK